MGPQHRHPHTGSRKSQLRRAHDLAGFVEHLQLLLAITVVLQRRVVQKKVEGQGVGQHLTHGLTTIEHGAAELAQLLHRPGTGAAGALISAHQHTPNCPPRRQGGQNQGEQDCCAVGVGNDAPMGKSSLGVHFWNHQRHLRIHSEGAGVVDNHRTSPGRHRSPLARHRAAG